MSKTILITGSAGFIGTHLVEHTLKNTDWNIVAMVRLTHAGDLNRLADVEAFKESGDRVKIIYHDLKGTISKELAKQIGHLDYIVHLAANSHVERSISEPKVFFEDNVIGTVNLLEFAREYHPKVPFLNFGTDEVFGAAPDGYNYKEDDRHRPSNPYSASKSGQIMAGHSYFVTYGMPIISTYTMNVFGERQHPEKLIPMAIQNILDGTPQLIHAKVRKGSTVSKNTQGKWVTTDPHDIEEVGQRHWLHARNAADAILFLLQNGVAGEHYNVVGDTELQNDELVLKIAEMMAMPIKFEYEDFHSARAGHDRRYALDGTKLKEMGWIPPCKFDDSLLKMINWELERQGYFDK